SVQIPASLDKILSQIADSFSRASFLTPRADGVRFGNVICARRFYLRILTPLIAPARFASLPEMRTVVPCGGIVPMWGELPVHPR
ncbi:MAG: hypothetical protein MI861_08760, partial [Pirellulales bacterium]|nr:hypothetical protein [Pirellulales bacterium]